MNEEIKILCVDDEENVLRSLKRSFMDEEYEILTAETGEEGLEIIMDQPEIQLVISDYRMPGMNGVDFLRQVYESRPDTIRMVLSGYADTASIVEAINEGQIYKFIPKPWNDDELKVTVAKALEVYFLHKQNKILTAELLESNEKLKHLNENLEQLVQKKTQEVFFQNKMLLVSQNILHSLPIAVIGMDTSGLIVQSNTMADTLFKGSCPSIINMMASEVLPSVLHEFIDRTYEEDSSNGKVLLERNDYWILGVKLEESGGQEGIILICIPDV